MKVESARGIGEVGSAALLVNPVGVVGRVGLGVSMGAAGAEAALTGSTEPLAKQAGGLAVERQLRILGFSEAFANRVGEGVSRIKEWLTK